MDVRLAKRLARTLLSGFVRAASHLLRRQESIWIDVGAHLGETTLEAARRNPRVTVYAFEPNLRLASQTWGLVSNYISIPMAVAEQSGCAEFFINTMDAASSLLEFVPEGLERWIGRERLAIECKVTVPTIRLDTFMDLVGISKVDYLKIDAQGADLSVVKGAGSRLTDIGKIMLEVAITPQPLYKGAATRPEIMKYLDSFGFVLCKAEKQSSGQEENLTFVRGPASR